MIAAAGRAGFFCAVAGAAFAVGGVAAAQAESAQAEPAREVIVDVFTPPYVPAPPRTQAADPAEISGIRIESNGALITGPINARRTYIPLDRPMIADTMRGHWARSAEACTAPPAGGQAAAKDNVMLTQRMILARQPMQILQTYVPLPSHISFAMLQSGKPMMVRARQHQRAGEILVIYSLPDGTRDYAVLRLSPDKQSITMQSRHSIEKAVRCAA